MRTPEEIGKEVREYIEFSSTHFLHYHDKEGRTTEGKALFLGGPLDMVVARVEAIVRDERQHQAKLEARIKELEAAQVCKECGGTDSVCGKAWLSERAKLEAEISAYKLVGDSKEDRIGWLREQLSQAEARVKELEGKLKDADLIQHGVDEGVAQWQEHVRDLEFVVKQRDAELTLRMKQLAELQEAGGYLYRRLARVSGGSDREAMDLWEVTLKNLMGRAA